MAACSLCMLGRMGHTVGIYLFLTVLGGPRALPGAESTS